MRTFATVALSVILPAMCIANPVPDPEVLFLEFDDGMNCIWPSPSTTFTVTVFLDNMDVIACGEDGTLGVAFMFDRTFGGFKLSQTNLLPGLDFGDVEAGGWAITAGADCVAPDADGVIRVAEVEYLYLGTPGVIDLLPHPVDGNVFADCDNLLCTWPLPVVAGGVVGVGMEPPRGCYLVPIEDYSWGSIKALYR